MSFHGGLRRLSMASFTVHIPPYSFMFVHIRSYSSIFVHIHGFIYVHIRSYSSIFVHSRYHLRPFTTIYDHLRPWAWEAWLFPKYQNCVFRKYKNPITSNPYEMNLLQRKIENRGYLENQDLIDENLVNLLFHQKHEIILWSLRSFWVGRYVPNIY